MPPTLSDKGIWGSMVALDQAVQRAVMTSATSGGTPEALEAGHDLDLALQRHRTAFVNLLRNPPKNANERYFLIYTFVCVCTRVRACLFI